MQISRLDKIALNDTVPAKSKYIRADTARLRELTGDYQVKPGMVATILLVDGKLMIDTHNDPLSELLPKSETLFDFSDMPATIEFFRDSTGKPAKFVFRDANLTLEAKKIK